VQNADVASIARSPQSCSTHKVSLFPCLLGICANCWRCDNQRFTHLLPSARQRSSLAVGAGVNVGSKRLNKQKRLQRLLAWSPFVSSTRRGRWDRNRTCTLRLWSWPRFVRQCSCVSTDAESYWLMPSGVSSCVHLCRPGLLSELLSNAKRFYGKSRALPLAACATSTITDGGHTGMPTSRLSGVSGGNLPLRANATSARQ
jgi:hypothetical protein